MLLVWAAAAAVLIIHAVTVRDYLGVVSELGRRGGGVPATPLQQPYPAFAADAQTWVRHAVSLLEGNGPQLRATTIDNAPHGREVHWNSAWAWAIAGGGYFDHRITGTPLLQAVERTTIWLPSAAFLLLILFVSGWVARRAGALAGAVVTIAMVGHPRVYEGFFPSYVDHHGLLCVSVLGMTLAAAFMGAGWWRPSEERMVVLPRTRESVRSAAIVSALFGAFGLWVSAASVIAPIAIVAFAGLIAVGLRGRAALSEGVQFDPEAWRLWGRVGAAASLVFYLIEYFPFHLGFRLESNHPFYALAWWGGAEIIAEIGSRFLGDPKQWWSRLGAFALPVVAVLVAPLTIAIWGTRVFVVMDPFLSRLHSDYIQEFLPLWRTISTLGWKTILAVVAAENAPLLVAIGLLIVRGRRVPVSIWFCVAAGLLLSAMAWTQSRWLLNASGVQVTLTVVLLAYGLGTVTVKPWVRWTAGLALAAVVFAPHAYLRIKAGFDDLAARRVTPKDAQSALWRDIALAIRQSQPAGDITLLTSPNSSTTIGYYGRFKTLGTLYWENSEGLKAAASVLAAKTQNEAAALIQKLGITHLAIVSEEHFIDSYYRLLHPGAPVEEVKKCFGLQLLVDRVVPPWLQMVPYKVPDDLSGLKVTVMLFKVAFNQTPADALYHIALAKIALGELEPAEKDIDTLIQQTPVSFQPWLRKGEILFARQDFDGAAEATINGIKRAPLVDQPNLYANAASSFFRQRAHAQAAQIYRAALEELFVPELAAYLAFILATSSDDSLRNGKEALHFAERALQVNPNSPTFLNSQAVAYAELGQFENAIKSATDALANARAQGDAAAQAVSEQRLAAFQAKRPWRE